MEKTTNPTSQHYEDAFVRSTTNDEKPGSISREAIGGASVDDLPANYFWSYKFIGSYIAFGLAYQSNFLGFTMIANVLTVIDAELGPSDQLIWVLLSYILAESVTLTVIGQLSDIFGRRWYYIGGSVLSVIGAIVCCRATSINMIIGGMVPSGIGGGVQAAGSIASGEMVPNKHRYIALGAIFMLLSPISSIGPGLARTFIVHTSAGWRWCYYVLIIISGVSLILQIFCYFPPSFKQLHQGRTKMQLVKQLDYGGIVLFSGSLACVLLGISWGGQKYPWKSGNVIGTIVGGVFGMGVFFIYENISGVKNPLIPMHLLKNLNYVTLMVCSSMGVMVFYALSIIWPQQIVAIFGKTGTTVGWMSCTLTAGAVAGQGIGAVVTAILPGLKYQLICACCIFTIFISAMGAISPSREGMAVSFSILGAIGIGYMEVITVAGGILMVDPENVGVAIGIQYALRLGLSSLSTSIYATILTNEVTKNLPAYVIPAVMVSGLNQTTAIQLLGALATGNTTAIESVPGVTPSILVAATTASKAAYQKSFETVYFVSIAFGIVAIITAVIVNNKKLNEVMTSNIAKKLQGVGEPRMNDEENDSRSFRDH